MARSTGSAHLDALLQDPALRYYIDREIRYGQTKALEVVLSLIMMAFGAVLLWPEPTFVGPAWRVIGATVTEPVAGTIALVVGAIRLRALHINGSGRRTPIPRTLGCLGGWAFWTALAIGFALAVPPLSTGLAVYPVLAMAELFSAKRAAADAFVLDTFNLRGRIAQSEREGRPAREAERVRDRERLASGG